MKIKLISALALLLCVTGCKNAVEEVNILPIPLKMEGGAGSFDLSSSTTIYTNITGQEALNLVAYIEQYAGVSYAVDTVADRENSIQLVLVDSLCGIASPEGYTLTIDRSRVVIEATQGVGIFYGVQSLLQLIEQYAPAGTGAIPSLAITDEPRFEYRGLHLDVSRHFVDKDFVKRQLDILAYYKMNRFHWHLTDGAGWRIEIKKYPLLTEIAAWRPYENWQSWWDGGRKYCKADDPKAKGGFYTQDEIREVVAYAQKLHITIIPEIEMPAHSEEVLAVYPQLSCSGKPYMEGDFCIGNENTFTFVEDVLTEVMALFPSKMIHIGGDEASKSSWRTCPKCAARMKAEGLANVDELQSYMIHRVEVFLNAHGRDLVGWDEILEGGLAPGATVMSWRGEEGGLAAIKQGNRAIMSPGEFCYLDYYQDIPAQQPLAIGGYTPLSKVYSYSPNMDSLTVEQQKLLLGVQANVWAEYITTPEHCEMMIYPRLFAIAEVGWSADSRKDWESFHRRALVAVKRMQEKGYTPFDLANEVGERTEALSPIDHLAKGAKVSYNQPIDAKYPAAGEATLVDGVLGGWTYGDKRWQGFTSTDLDVVVDLGEPQPITSVTATFMQDKGPWVWMPAQVIIESSLDGKTFTPLATLPSTIDKDALGLFFQEYGWNGTEQARYIRYVANRNDIAGGWIFTDEIVVK